MEKEETYERYVHIEGMIRAAFVHPTVFEKLDDLFISIEHVKEE